MLKHKELAKTAPTAEQFDKKTAPSHESSDRMDSQEMMSDMLDSPVTRMLSTVQVFGFS